MQVHVSTDDIAPHDRVRFWCDYFGDKVHSITPSEVPDAGAFSAEASGSIAGEFALLDIKSGLERVRRTAADIAKDKTEAFFVRRFRVPVIWRAAPRSTPVDLIHEPGDFCVSSTEWEFDAESKGPASFDILIIPQAALSPLLTGGRLQRPFRLPSASPLGSLLGAAIDAAKMQAPLLPDELGEAVLRNLCGLVALTCRASDDDTEQGRDSLHSPRLAAVKHYVDLHLADPNLTPTSAATALGISARQPAPAVRAEQHYFRPIRFAPATAPMPRHDRRRDGNWPVGGRYRFWLGVQQYGDILSRVRERVW